MWNKRICTQLFTCWRLIFWTELDFGRMRTFHYSLCRSDNWHDGWRRTLNSWRSHECQPCGSFVVNKLHFAPKKATSAAGQSWHSSVDFCFLKKSCTNEKFCRIWGHVHFKSPFVEITFYNLIHTCVKVLLDVLKVLYREQICRSLTVNKITTLSLFASFF